MEVDVGTASSQVVEQATIVLVFWLPWLSVCLLVSLTVIHLTGKQSLLWRWTGRKVGIGEGHEHCV